MKLQVGKLPKNNKGDLLITVDYDADDDGNCKKSFTKGYPQGTVFEVPDDLGAAILSRYAKHVGLADASGGKVPAKDKGHDGPTKTA